MLGVRQRDLGDLAAELLDQRQRRLEDLAHAGVDRVVGELARDAEAQARRGPRGWAASTPGLDPDRGRVAGVAALHRAAAAPRR